jgi:hypothetical protein
VALSASFSFVDKSVDKYKFLWIVPVDKRWKAGINARISPVLRHFSAKKVRKAVDKTGTCLKCGLPLKLAASGDSESF